MTDGPVVHHLLSGAGPLDAVTNQARLWHRLMSEWGISGGLWADAIDPRVGREFRPARHLLAEIGPGESILVHYSAYGQTTSRALELPNPLLVAYHNITPPEHLWDHEPVAAALCAAARHELPRLARRADAACAVSSYNARELTEAGAGEVAVIPNALEPERLPNPPPDGRPDPGDSPTLLFVGRLAPHKRHDRLIRALADLRAHHRPAARLVLVGGAISDRYTGWLRSLAAELGVGDAVELTGPVGDEELASRYRLADLFCCLSDHEGFCIPVLEAMAADLPVIAHGVGGLTEVAGDAAVMLDRPDPAALAEAGAIVLDDPGLATEMAHRGRKRVERHSVARVGVKLRAWLEAALGG